MARGDVVLQLDPGPFETNLKRVRAGLALAQAEAAQARQELERVQRLAEQEVAPPRQLDLQLTHLAVARARVEQELAAVESAEQDLVRTAVISPYHAHVVERELHEGAIVGPGSVVVTIQEQTGFAAELDVPAAAAAPVQVGDPALLIVEGAADRSDGRGDRRPLGRDQERRRTRRRGDHGPSDRTAGRRRAAPQRALSSRC